MNKQRSYVHLMTKTRSKCHHCWEKVYEDARDDIASTDITRELKLFYNPRSADRDTAFADLGWHGTTASGNKISVRSELSGSQNIMLKGKSIIREGSVIRANRSTVQIGKFSYIGCNTILMPALKTFTNGFTVLPLKIGDYVYIDDNSVIQCTRIGSYVHIGKNCVISEYCIIKDCCVLEDNTVLPTQTIVPPFVRISGNPGKIVGFLPNCTQNLMIDIMQSIYNNFRPSPRSLKFFMPLIAERRFSLVNFNKYSPHDKTPNITNTTVGKM
ncbi:Dynactin subunit 5 [Trichinella pseudospiralis]|uniref:Dynactin subunit 5 n=1 Tax=Trichinella pseudospiralis TaxID=6337 RepID=A0A0V1G193_TRIPS|nr:Dynactin subunit 5 [Trichinella pseudospiralis]